MTFGQVFGIGEAVRDQRPGLRQIYERPTFSQFAPPASALITALATTGGPAIIFESRRSGASRVRLR
jgi:hypothetical protein